jgi:hypothetical protein
VRLHQMILRSGGQAADADDQQRALANLATAALQGRLATRSAQRIADHERGGTAIGQRMDPPRQTQLAQTLRAPDQERRVAPGHLGGPGIHCPRGGRDAGFGWHLLIGARGRMIIASRVRNRAMSKGLVM